MEDTIIYIPEVRYSLQKYTSERFQDYLRNYSQEMVLIVANANIDILKLFKDKNKVIEDIVKEDPSNFIRNIIGPNVGGTWLISGKQIEENASNALTICSSIKAIETRDILDGYLSDNLVRDACSLDRVVDDFSDQKEAIKYGLDRGLDAESLILKYLSISVRANFDSASTFSNAFNKKYQFYRALQGDYFPSFKDILDLNRKFIMAKFNKNLAPKIISEFASELFYDPSNN